MATNGEAAVAAATAFPADYSAASRWQCQVCRCPLVVAPPANVRGTAALGQQKPQAERQHQQQPRQQDGSRAGTGRGVEPRDAGAEAETEAEAGPTVTRRPTTKQHHPAQQLHSATATTQPLNPSPPSQRPPHVRLQPLPPQAAATAAAAAAAAAAGGLAGRLEESFVVLPATAASTSSSVYGSESSSVGERGSIVDDSAGGAGGGGGGRGGRGDLSERLAALDRVFNLVSQQMQVDLPLCMECASSTCAEMESQVREAENDIAAYEAALDMLRGSSCEAAGEECGDEEEEDEEERQMVEELSRLTMEREEAQRQLGELQRQKEELDAEEERYWHDFNEFQHKVAEHTSNRDAVLARFEVTTAQLQMLKDAHALHDAFHIWHDREFGTISNFRLGRLPSVPVEWNEMNAAWGQACLLLDTMTKLCGCPLKYRIIPMGSYPKIADGKSQYELFGPVNLFWSTRYDHAMVLFAACLKQFAEFAQTQDRQAGLPPDKCFRLPYPIEGDKVNGLTIKQSFNRDERWTKALRYTLCNLKWLMLWLITTQQQQQQQLQQMHLPQQQQLQQMHQQQQQQQKQA